MKEKYQEWVGWNNRKWAGGEEVAHKGVQHEAAVREGSEQKSNTERRKGVAWHGESTQERELATQRR